MNEQRAEELISDNYRLRQERNHYAELSEELQTRINELERVIGKRVAPDYPQEWRPDDLDGKWFNLEELDSLSSYLPKEEDRCGIARGIDFYETRSDGRVGQVFEISMSVRDLLGDKNGM